MNKQLMELDFQIACGATRHFGRNLYTSNPPAIAELVANAWDAYAQKCTICYTASSMLIIDNGIGMTDAEFQDRYATSGNEKDTNIRKPKNMKLRPYMGKKGIGKFAAFSLSDEYILFTKSDEDVQWKRIEVKQEILKSKTPTVKIGIQRLNSIPDLEKQFSINFNQLGIKSGTIIYLPKLRRNVTAGTVNSTQKLLSHRFSITTIINDGNFVLQMMSNGKPTNVDLEKHFYYDNVEYVHYFGYTNQEISNKFPHLDNSCLKQEKALNTELKGWIASVDVPTSLAVSDEDDYVVKGVSVYINGKLVDEEIFKNIKKDRMVDTYIIGEVDADYLGLLSEDVVLSSREGLSYEDERVRELKKYLEAIRKNLVSEWDDMRSNRDITKQEYIQSIFTKPRNKEYYEKLDETAKKRFNKYAQKLFDRPKDVNRPQDMLIDLMFSALFQIVNDESLQELFRQANTNEAQILQCFEKVFNLTELNHAIRLRENVRNNLLVIKELEKYIEGGEVEKVFESHLGKNPWLIEPTWIANVKSVHSQNYYKLLGIDNDSTSRLYTDLIIEVSDEQYPVIVEIKREKATNYSAPDINTICTQVYNYQKALSTKLGKEFNKDIPALAIKAYFICGSIALEKLNKDDRDRLDQVGIKIKSYDQLIRTSKQIYQVNFGEDLSNI